MSKIFDLINELCPNGVEFVELGEIFQRIKGTNITANKMKEIEVHGGDIRIFAGGKTVIDTTEDKIQNPNITRVPSVIVQSRGVIDFIYYDKPFTFKNEMWGYTSENETSIKFLYYYLKNNISYFRAASISMGALPQISLPITEKFKLPVPPMEVQREIVRILDSFTLLTAELTAELTARKKQYEFYRDFLLNFNENQNEIEWDIIDNIFIMKNGYTPSKANKDFWENGTISWYRMEDIRENGRILSESIQKITPQAVKGGKLIPKNSIIVATTATIGEHALAIADSFLMNQQFTSFTIRELLKDKLDIKFVFYYFFKICEWCKQNTNSSSFPSVDMAKLKKVKFPIPSLQTQQKVVDILDKFDTLVNSITEGLPREIELRRKQYEYYRELLLNFKPNESIKA